jgi:hypothetical protein
MTFKVNSINVQQGLGHATIQIAGHLVGEGRRSGWEAKLANPLSR